MKLISIQFSVLLLTLAGCLSQKTVHERQIQDMKVKIDEGPGPGYNYVYIKVFDQADQLQYTIVHGCDSTAPVPVKDYPYKPCNLIGLTDTSGVYLAYNYEIAKESIVEIIPLSAFDKKILHVADSVKNVCGAYKLGKVIAFAELTCD